MNNMYIDLNVFSPSVKYKIDSKMTGTNIVTPYNRSSWCGPRAYEEESGAKILLLHS